MCHRMFRRGRALLIVGGLLLAGTAGSVRAATPPQPSPASDEPVSWFPKTTRERDFTIAPPPVGTSVRMHAIIVNDQALIPLPDGLATGLTGLTGVAWMTCRRTWRRWVR